MNNSSTTKPSALYLDTLIDNFGCFCEHPASVKHAKTGQYIFCNGNLARRDGIPIESYIGLTSQGVEKIMGWKPSVTSQAVSIDQQISAQKIPEARYNQVILAHDKSVVIEEVFKKPVLGQNNQVTAILAYAHNVTHHAHPVYLFSLYSSYHPTQEAIRYFLRYKDLDTAFEVLPSREELVTLLTMRDTPNLIEIAQILNCSINDVERYQAQLTDKLKVIGVNEVLTRLKWHSESSEHDAIN